MWIYTVGVLFDRIKTLILDLKYMEMAVDLMVIPRSFSSSLM
jgi:hypothetical protein